MLMPYVYHCRGAVPLSTLKQSPGIGAMGSNLSLEYRSFTTDSRLIAWGRHHATYTLSCSDAGLGLLVCGLHFRRARVAAMVPERTQCSRARNRFEHRQQSHLSRRFPSIVSGIYCIQSIGLTSLRTVLAEGTFPGPLIAAKKVMVFP